MYKQTRKAKSFPKAMTIAATVSMTVTLLGSAGIAVLLNMARITWEQAGYWIMGMLFVSSFIGAKCAFAAIKCQRILISMISGMLYWGLMLCIAALFFGGRLDAIWETAGIIGAGSGTAALLTFPVTTKNRKKISRVYC